jgi:hypothetical protein
VTLLLLEGSLLRDDCGSVEDEDEATKVGDVVVVVVDDDDEEDCVSVGANVAAGAPAIASCALCRCPLDSSPTSVSVRR